MGTSVAPAKAGAHKRQPSKSWTALYPPGRRVWIPAFAGMTTEENEAWRSLWLPHPFSFVPFCSAMKSASIGTNFSAWPEAAMAAKLFFTASPSVLTAPAESAIDAR